MTFVHHLILFSVNNMMFGSKAPYSTLKSSYFLYEKQAMRCVLRYNRDILGKKEISMSFKENNCQQISFTDTFLA